MFISAFNAGTGYLVESSIQRARSLRQPPPLSRRRMARRPVGASHIANTSAIDLTTGSGSA